MTSEIQRWGDAQQYHAEPQPGFRAEGGVEPRVTLLSMSADPLGEIASFNQMYSGKVARDLGDITNLAREQALEDVQKTHLQAPLEAVKVHFLLEGVDRAFTHQLVRQRTAVYAQESMRFAVMGPLAEATTLPPSLAELPADSELRREWNGAIEVIDAVYHRLVDSGIPAEEARGLLPHCTATRIHYVTDLRNLIGHAGNRLCTQAQFHWRQVFNGIVQEIRDYPHKGGRTTVDPGDDWQFEAIADSQMFRPVCYQLGHCPFQASFDRACIIRDRVEAFAEQGVSSDEWHLTKETRGLAGIHPNEWLLVVDAARR